MSSPIAFVKNTFLNFVDEEPLEFRRLSPSKTIDLGCLKNIYADDCESTGCCNSLASLENMSNMSVADSEEFFADSEDALEDPQVVAAQNAALHACGECKPCVFANKAGGCKNDECGFCHEEHSKEFLKFIRKRNRAMRMAELHGDEPRCAQTYQQYAHQRQCC